ncbi:MAG TPA: hypothetical protein VIW73_09045 [Candidatus Cybelea sp.]
MDERRFRFDLFVALLALVISGVAAGASAYQTYVIRKQFSATVWPYISFITTSSIDKYFELDVDNAGIGPALILDSVITRDGKVVQRAGTPIGQPAISAAIDPERAAAKSDEVRSREHGSENMTASTILPGDVVPAGQKLEVLRVEGKFLTHRVMASIRRVDLTLCYCSLLGDCWTKRLWERAVQPHPVRSCPNA